MEMLSVMDQPPQSSNLNIIEAVTKNGIKSSKEELGTSFKKPEGLFIRTA